MKHLFFMAVLCCLAVAASRGETDSTLTAWDDFLPEKYSGEHKPHFTTRMYPAEAVADTVTCSLSLFRPLPESDGDPARVVLTCADRPDAVPPTVTVDGRMLEKMGESSSFQMQNGLASREYRYWYRFYPPADGVFKCRVEGLKFGGVGYDGSLEFSIGMPGGGGGYGHNRRSDMPAWTFVVAAFLCLGLEGLVVGLLFRREGREELVSFVLRHKRLPLSPGWAMTHYGFPLMVLSVPVFLALLAVFRVVGGQSPDGSSAAVAWCVVVSGVVGAALVCVQRSKLTFWAVHTRLTKSQVREALLEAAAQWDWEIDPAGDDCLVAVTHPSGWSFTWGEQIFVVFDKGRIWVNSVNDLNKRTAVASFGYTKRNVRRVVEAIVAKETAPNEKNR